MTPSQVAVVNRLTMNAQRLAEMLADVPMVWSVEPSHGKVMLIGSNTACTRRWFDQHRMVFALIGKCGGVKMCDGTDKLYRSL